MLISWKFLRVLTLTLAVLSVALSVYNYHRGAWDSFTVNVLCVVLNVFTFSLAHTQVRNSRGAP